MSDLLPAVTGPPQPAEWRAMQEQAVVIASSGLAPQAVNTKEKVLVIALKGRELALPPMQALSHINVIKGKPTLSAELMRALVQRAGHKFRVVSTSETECTVEGVRSDDPDNPTRVTWDLDRAKKAGLTDGPWKTYTAAMLLARATSELCRAIFADVLMGCSYTPEELGAEVVVADDGAVTVESDDGDPDVSVADDLEHARVLSELGALLPSLPEDKREAMKDYASRSLANAKVGLERTRELIASEPGDPPPDKAPFERASDDLLADLTYELDQLKPGLRKKEVAGLLADAGVSTLEELDDRTARAAQERLTRARAQRDAEKEGANA